MAYEEQDYIDGWRVYSDWIDDLREESDVISTYDQDVSYQKNLVAQTSNGDRFKVLWQDDRIRADIEKKFRIDLASCDRRKTPGKSTSESKRFRELGNKSFKNKNYSEALHYYTQAVRFASYPDQNEPDDTLALALANRSAASYSLTKYRLCLLDIDLAIKYGYPEANMFKLLIRKTKCLHILSVWANDVEDIKDQLRGLLREPNTKDYIKAEINGMFEFLEKTNPETMEKDESDVREEPLMKVSNPSKTLSHAGDCVEMSYNPEKGRYLITNKDVLFGRLLVGEQPYVCNLAPCRRNQYCYSCFGRLHSCGLSCKNCTQVLYCSEKCLEAKADIHDLECNKFLNFQDELGVAYLVAHIVFKTRCQLDEIPIYSRKVVDLKTLDEVINIPMNDWPDLVFKSDYASVLSLQDHAEDYEYDSMMGFALTAVYLLTALKSLYVKDIPCLQDDDKVPLVGSVILRHLLQLQTNLISILDQDLQGLVSVGPNLSAIKETPIGVGIYPTISLLNHSCSPNVLSLFHRNKFVIRAAKTLECGSEINYCYGPCLRRDTKVDRQSQLRNQYFFTCDCDSCSQNIEDETRAFICPSCKGPVVYNRDRTNQCLRCRKKDPIDADAHLKYLESLKAEFIDIKENVEDYNLKIEKLLNLESKLRKIVYWRQPILVELKSEMLNSAEEAGDMENASKYCQEELEMSVAAYGPESYETIMVQMKLINYNWQKLYESIESAEVSKDQGIIDLRALIGTISDTRGKLRELIASTNILSAELSFQTELKFLSQIYNSVNKYVSSLECGRSVPSTDEIR